VQKQSETISAEMEILRAEIKVITENDEATDEEVARGDTLIEEYKTKDVLRTKALKREADVDEVMRASLNPGNREDGAAARRGPEVMRQVDPFEPDAGMQDLMRSAVRHPETVSFDAESTIDRARRAVDNTPVRVSDKTKERLHLLLEDDEDANTALLARHILLTGSAEYRRQFHEHVASGGRHYPDLLRTAMSLTAGNGGVLVPHYLDPTIILTNAGVYAGTIRALATVKTIATKQWEGVSSAGVSAQWTGEGTATTDDSPTFTNPQPTILTHKADAWLSGSYEVLQDTGFSGELGRLLGDAKDRLEEDTFATGNSGTTKARGVVAAVAAVTASIVTCSMTTGTFVVGDVHNVSNAVTPRSEQNLAWLAHKAIYSKVRQFDTSGGGGFWANLNVGQPPILLGAPALKSAVMSSSLGNSTAGTNVLLAGDFSQYYIVDRIGMSVIYDPLIKSATTGAPMGQAGWYAFWRTGADVVNADAFRLLQLNSTAAYTALA
jgi:HK97 family phage major capsid protein